jgi:hypothetical protein
LPFTTLEVSFSLKQPARVEVILTGSDAELWLTRVVFLPANPRAH